MSRVRTPEGALRTLFLRTKRLPRGRCFLFYKGLRTFGHHEKYLVINCEEAHFLKKSFEIVMESDLDTLINGIDSF